MLNNHTEYEGMLSYITLDVVGQTGSFCFNGNSRSGVGALDIGVVIVAVVQLGKQMEKKKMRFAILLLFVCNVHREC